MNKYQEASEEYKKNPKSATKIAKQFGLNVSHFCKYLKSIGIQVINNQNRTKFNECIFDIIDTEEKAYWLGFILADGSISSCKTQKRYQFELSLSEQDKAHLDKFNVFMQHEKDNVKLSYTWVNGKKFSRCRWIINNKHLWSRLNELGCIPNKTLLLTFPYVPKSLVKHLIRGYFDGDGSLGIYTYKSSTKVSCSCIGTSEMLNNILKNVQINAQLC